MAVTEKQLANLNPPKKGEVRNPKGRGKGVLNTKTVITKWLTLAMDIKHPISGEIIKGQVIDSMTLALIGKARKGDVAAFNALIDRVEGKPTTPIEQTGKDGKDFVPSVINIVPIGPNLPLSRDENEVDV